MEKENREELESELPEEELFEEEPKRAVEDRPAWHRVLAWVAVVLFAAVVAMFYIHMFRGGK